MDVLRDIVGDRIVVECPACRRRGVYGLARLLARFGPTTPQLVALRHLTASCRYQRMPNAPPFAKYDPGCQARFILPEKPNRKIPTPRLHGLSIDVWKPNGNVEWHLATVWSFDFGHAAFAAALPLYPDRDITLRQDCRVIAKRELP